MNDTDAASEDDGVLFEYVAAIVFVVVIFILLLQFIIFVFRP